VVFGVDARRAIDQAMLELDPSFEPYQHIAVEILRAIRTNGGPG
jgi:hypothetical protein